MNKRIRIIFGVAVSFIILCATATALYASDYYRAVDVEACLTSGDGVTVSRIKEGYYFDGKGEEKALIFYPGAKIEETAYSPIMRLLAEQGVDCFLIKMPLRMAFLDMNKANDILNEYNYKDYYLAGHSLGGAMAANYAAKHTEEYSGLFLLAAYPTKDLTAAQFPVVFIYGENDSVLNRNKLKRGFSLVSSSYEALEIKGGNHAGFGSYGSQDGDGEATISSSEQQIITTDYILESVNNPS